MLANGALDMSNDGNMIYREELRNFVMNQISKHSKFQPKHHTCSHLSGESSQHFKDHSLRAATQVNKDLVSGMAENQGRYQIDQAQLSGGDADRYFCGDICLHRNGQSNSLRHSHSNKAQALAMPNKVDTGPGRYQQTTPREAHVEDYIADHRNLCDTLSNLGSEGSSVKSQKSSKTVVSRKSSHDLRKHVISQCKFKEAIDETLQQMCNPEDLDKSQNEIRNMLYEKSTMQLDSLPLTHCKHYPDKMHPSQSYQKNVTTEIGKTDFAESHNGDTLTIPVDDVVNSKVINPIIRKLQRMYLNNLKEEMSLMEDLERLPHKVNEVYKATIFKQRE